ncbi:hypothetical protein [Reichenbachiella sp.]
MSIVSQNDSYFRIQNSRSQVLWQDKLNSEQVRAPPFGGTPLETN